MKRQLVAATAALALGAAGVTAAQAEGERALPQKSLAGVWVVTVDPAATPAGDPPPFESTLAYSSDHVVSEITSRAVSSAGLGRWRKTGAQTYGTSWWKYRFDATGAFVGKTVVTEQIEMMGEDDYSASSITRIVDPSGARGRAVRLRGERAPDGLVDRSLRSARSRPRMCGPGRSRSPMRSTALAAALLTLAGGGALTGVGAAAPAAPTYELLSVNSRERAANDRTYDVDVSGSGRYVVFSSEGRNLSGRDVDEQRAGSPTSTCATAGPATTRLGVAGHQRAGRDRGLGRRSRRTAASSRSAPTTRSS